MKAHIIQLVHHDDVVSIKDKISWSKAPRVLLVWPKRGRFILRQADLVLLQRHALTLGCQVGLVTKNPEMVAVARELNVPVFTSTLVAQRRTWRKKPAKQIEHPAQYQAENQRPIRRTSETLPWWVRTLAFSTGLLAVLVLAGLFIPSAVVRIYSMQKEQSIDLVVWADPELKTVNMSGGMPAVWQKETVEGRASLDATGTTLVPDQYASGIVLLTNLTDRNVVATAGMVVTSLGAEPVSFETIKTVTVPAGIGAQAECPVRAVQPGPAGNLDAATINAIEGSQGLSLTVTNPAPTQGGSQTRQPAPTEADYNRLRKQILDNLQAQAHDQINSQLGQDRYLVDGIVRVKQVLREIPTPGLGEAGDQLSLDMEVEFEFLVVSRADLDAIARIGLNANLPPGFTGRYADISFTLVQSPELTEDGIANWKMTAVRVISADYLVEDIRNHLLGAPLQEAASRISDITGAVEKVEVTISPRWFPRMPLLPYQIHIEED